MAEEDQKQWKVIGVSFTEEVADISVSLTLDDEKNLDKTEFQTKDDIWFRFFCNIFNVPKTYTSSAGVITKRAVNLPLEIGKEEGTEEVKIFSQTDTVTLNYMPSGAVETSWVGKSGGTISIDGQTITVPEKIVGVLKCKYTTFYDNFKLVSDTAGTINVCGTYSEKSACLIVTVTDPTDPVAYELEVRDYCSDAIIPGATIYFDGQDIGNTDSNGVINLGKLLPGSSHSLKITKTGYIDSDKDKLNNAIIEVPS